MTIPASEEVTTKEQARDLAIEWQHSLSNQPSLSYDELHAWQVFFVGLANRFDLTEEFTENAII